MSAASTDRRIGGVGPVRVEVFPDKAAGCRMVAQAVAGRLRERAAEGRMLVLGLPTGSTPIPFYGELVRLHRKEGLSLANVVTFNLDEYCGLRPEDPQSYHSFMRHHLFDHVDIPPDQVHIPEGMTAGAEISAHCGAYEEAITAAGGIDIQFLGIGHNGHIGFNEPGSGRETRTRLVQLDEVTRRMAADAFGGLESVPTEALTMGVATILDAREIVLFAWGDGKAQAVARALQEPAGPEMPATYLQTHPSVSFILDEGAASQLDL